MPVPHIFYSSLDFGFFLLDDLGDELLLHHLSDDNADELYGKALNALFLIQQTPCSSIPSYDERLLLQEMELFRQWFLNHHLTLHLDNNENKIFDDLYSLLIRKCDSTATDICPSRLPFA